MTNALLVWLVESGNLDNSGVVISVNDLKRIIEINADITHTSITKFSFKDNKWQLDTFAQTPHFDHLKEEERKELLSGTYIP